jgi:hypothetical protein
MRTPNPLNVINLIEIRLAVIVIAVSVPLYSPLSSDLLRALNAGINMQFTLQTSRLWNFAHVEIIKHNHKNHDMDRMFVTRSSIISNSFSNAKQQQM